MSESPASLPSPQDRAAATLGVLDAVGMAWRLMMSDFWRLWVAALLVWVISAAAGPAAIVVGPPLTAGLFYVLSRRLQGTEVDVAQVFQGFSQRLKESVIAGLVPWIVQFAAVIIWLPVHLVLILGGVALTGELQHDAGPLPFLAAFCCDFVVYGFLMLAALVVRMFFTFAQCAVWDRPGAGWEAAKDSYRLVRDHFGSVLGLWALFLLLFLAGGVAGYLACFVGMFFTLPLVELWYAASVLYLYRSWTGRPLVQAAVPEADSTAGEN